MTRRQQELVSISEGDLKALGDLQKHLSPGL
jgi:hypothetical protein